MPKLTQKQKKFADEYLISLNATQAAIKAGYSDKTAKEIGCENLTKPNIQEYIENRQKKLQQKVEIKQEDVLKELACIGFARATDYVEIKSGYVHVKDTAEIPEDKIGAISSIESGNFCVKVKFHNKLDALEKIGRHLGMFEKEKEIGEVEDLETLARMLNDD